ncbi:MAG TPA: UDP-glucose/GDP-mannose dehydrogenase family protein, partial [Acidimicrobiales bacterium]|nr:UDP-glucose/GDP-mannose dehydrogenase family protein [Acidimicrobiales bacterium]
FEPGLDDLLAAGVNSGALRFTAGVEEAMAASDVVFLCVGTPPAPDGSADMSHVVAAARSIGACLDRHHVLVTKSTVPIGSGRWLTSIVEDALPAGVHPDGAFSVVSNPEFLREGSAVNDFLFPDRVVMGSDDDRALDAVAEVYRPIVEQTFAGAHPDRRAPLVRTTLATAETVKYASNAFLATKISFINEIANVCELVGADVSEVASALGLDPRIGSRFLEAGLGWGGSCFGKDLSALVTTAGQYGYDATLLRAAVQVNERQRRLVIERMRHHLKIIQGRRIALLGLAFKPGTDDLRDAPAVEIAASLIRAGAFVRAHDPLVKAVPDCPNLVVAADPYAAAERADAVVLVTEWPDYLALDLAELRSRMRGDLVLDGRNLLDPGAVEAVGLRYEGVGRSTFTRESLSV